MASTQSELAISDRHAELLTGIDRVLVACPFWLTEGIRINGSAGLRAELIKMGITRTPSAIRSALKEKGLRTVGFGGVAASLPSRERLRSIIEQAVLARPDWTTTPIKVRGKNGLKAEVLRYGYDVNHVVICRVARSMGLNLWPKGMHHAAAATAAKI